MRQARDICQVIRQARDHHRARRRTLRLTSKTRGNPKDDVITRANPAPNRAK